MGYDKWLLLQCHMENISLVCTKTYSADYHHHVTITSKLTEKQLSNSFLAS